MASKNYCHNCIYVIPMFMKYDTNYRRYFCGKKQRLETDYILGLEFLALDLCSEVNSDGECDLFEEGKNRRFKGLLNAEIFEEER